MQQPSFKYHLIADFLSTLQAEGYAMGTGLHLQVEELLHRLPEDTPAEELSYLLAPLFAQNPQEQEQIHAYFRQSLRRTEAFFEEINEQEEPEEEKVQERRWRRLIIGLALALLIPPLLVLIWWITSPERQQIERPFTIQGGEQMEICLSDTLELQNWGAIDSARLIHQGYPQLGSVRLNEPECLSYLAQDSLSGTDSIVVELSLAKGIKALAIYKPHVQQAGEDVIVEKQEEDKPKKPEPPIPVEKEEVTSFIFEPLPYPYPHDLLAFAIQPPTEAWIFLANNFWWLKWIGLLLFTALLLAILFYRAHRRRKLVAEMKGSDKPPYAWNIRIEGAENIRLGDQFPFILNRMRQRTGSEAFQLDVPRTINATIQRAGMVDFQYRQQTRPPEYLLLIGQQGSKNHRARLFDYLYRNFKANEVLAERFFFDGDPRICYNQAFPEGIPLQSLQQRYGQARLMLLSNGNALLDKFSGKLVRWHNLFLPWKTRTLFTPRPPAEWGKRERRLGSVFSVLPASMQSLNFWLEELEAEEDAQFDAWPNHVNDARQEPIRLDGPLLPALKEQYSAPLLKWIAACAVYPSLHWELTLFLGQRLSEGQDYLPTAENILQLSRLPWFVEGKIPAPSRLLLVEWLQAEHPALLKEVRQSLAEVLQHNPPPADSSAFEDYRMNLALNEWLVAENAQQKQKIGQEIHQLMEAGNEVDVPIIKELKRERNALDFILPDSWKRRLYKQGLPGLGWRGEWGDVLRWALPLWLPALLIAAWPWDLALTDCEGALLNYSQEGESSLLCLDKDSKLATILEQAARERVRSGSLEEATSFYTSLGGLLRGDYQGAISIPAREERAESRWEWLQPANNSQQKMVELESSRLEATGSQLRFNTTGPIPGQDTLLPQLRSNMAIAFYNKGVALSLEKAEGLATASGDSLRAALSEEERSNICPYFFKALELDSALFNREAIRRWCAGDVPEEIPEEACFRVVNLSRSLALRSRPISREEARQLNENLEDPQKWAKLPINKESSVWSIPPGAQVELLEEGDSYYRVRYQWEEGYIVKTIAGKPVLRPCTQKAEDTTADAKTSGETPAYITELQDQLEEGARSWDRRARNMNFNDYSANSTIYPNVGVRGRYAILRPLLNPRTLENIIGTPVFRSGPHEKGEINFQAESAFGYYNPAFLSLLYDGLSSLSRNSRLKQLLQPLYNREFKNVLRAFYLTHDEAVRREDIHQEYQSLLGSRANTFTYRRYQFTELEQEVAQKQEGYDYREARTAAWFWVRRSIDGTEGEFYRLLRLALREFDPSFLAEQQLVEEKVPGQGTQVDRAPAGKGDIDRVPLVDRAPPGKGSIDRVPPIQQQTPAKPKLFLLSVGVPSEGLEYTAKDAQDLAASFRGQEGKLFNEANIRLLNTEAETSAEKIGEGIRILNVYSRNGMIGENDVVMLFISSQSTYRQAGKGDPGGYKIMGSNFKGSYSEAAALDYSNDIARALAGIPGKKLLLIDTDRAGMIDELGGENICVLGATRADQLAYTGKTWENSAFTRALLDAFANEPVSVGNKVSITADLNNDGLLTINELYNFVAQRLPYLVSSATGAEQAPFLSEGCRGQDVPIFAY